MLSARSEGERSDVMLPGVINFRDIAGPGYVTPAGPMRRGVLFRSNTFLAGPEDLEKATTLGIVAIHDLRGQGEVDKAPDVELPGAIWRHSVVPGLSKEQMAGLSTANDLREEMIKHWRGFVAHPAKRGGFAMLLSRIADEARPQVFHCAGGKDRTGWAAMLVQRLVGVGDADVIADFLLTNERKSARGTEVARMFFTDKPDDFLQPAMIADVAYLEAAVDQMEADYGDLIGYLQHGLNLTVAQIDSLRDRFRS